MTAEVKSALLFPGQGLAPQDIIDCYHQLQSINPDYTRSRITFTQGVLDKIHGAKTFDLRASLENKDSPSFGLTSFVQPVVYTLSVLTAEIVADTARIAPKLVAGHSLGEYSALTKARVIPFEKGVEIVTYRGLVMQEACEENPSSLISINGLTEESVRNEVCQQTGAEIALINAPTLIVVGVSKDGVTNIEKLAKEAGVKRVSILPTAGAFHTHFMQTASERLGEFIDGYEFSDPQIPVVANLTGELSNSAMILKKYIIEGMTKPVQWAKSLQTMIDKGIRLFVETGPGNSLVKLNSINKIPENQTITALSLG